MIKFSPRSTVVLTLLGLLTLMIDHSAKATEQPVSIRFAAKVGQQPFSCGSTYSLGAPAISMTPADFRFYLSDVVLIESSGKTAPIKLSQDGKWQYQNVALLDFEDKTGACTNGTAETRDRVVGTVPRGNYTGLKFTLGVPFKLNHADATLAPSPLNLTGLWWNWQSGYKFLRLDLQTQQAKLSMQNQHSLQGKVHQLGKGHQSADSGGFPIHLGSTGCRAVPQSMPCRNPNAASVVLSPFNPAQNMVVADLAQLVASSNLGQNQPQTPPGCMAAPEDKDCLSIMTRLGLPFMNKPTEKQAFFSLQSLR